MSELTAPPRPSDAIAWLGEAPADCAFPVVAVPSLEAFAALRPLPGVLVWDDPRGDEARDLLALAQPCVREVVPLLMVRNLEPALQALALLHGVQCLPRGWAPAVRDGVLNAALARAGARRRPDALLATAASCTVVARYVLRTLEEAEGLATLLALGCPEPERRVGGFLELLINAIEHGNLEVSGPTKRALLAEGRWADELRLRLEDPRFSQRVVRVDFERVGEAVTFVIEDEGGGFDAEAVLRAGLEHDDTRHGRGVALARLMSFDELVYQGRGNRLVGRIR